MVKNKVAPPFKQAEFEIVYGSGISRAGELIDLGVEMDIFGKSGAWYSYQGNKIGQGKAQACEWLKNHPEEQQQIEEQIKANIRDSSGNKEVAPAEEVFEEDLEDIDNA